jgi:hypothetical protein
MKIRPVGVDFFHADEETDMMKLTLASRNFANLSKNEWVATFPSLSPCYKLGTTKVTTAFPTEQQDQSCRRISASDPLQSRCILQETPVIFSTDLSVVTPFQTFVSV